MRSFLNIHDQAEFFENRSELRDLLSQGKYTTLALSDGNDSYVLTLNYGLDETEDILYFYCSSQGTKLDFFKSNPYLCGTVIQENSSTDGNYNFSYQSVVYFGLLEVIHNKDEKIKALRTISRQLKDDSDLSGEQYKLIEDSHRDKLIMKLTIDEMKGKKNPG